MNPEKKYAPQSEQADYTTDKILGLIGFLGYLSLASLLFDQAIPYLNNSLLQLFVH